VPASRGGTTVELLGKITQIPQRFGLEPTVGQLLDSIGEPVLQEVPVVGRWLGLEEIAPFLLQCANQRGLQGGQLG
jgi:hypothetical protein